MTIRPEMLKRCLDLVVSNGWQVVTKNMSKRWEYMELTVDIHSRDIKIKGPNWLVKSDKNLENTRIVRGSEQEVVSYITLMVLST